MVPAKNEVLGTAWDGRAGARTLRKRPMTDVLDSHHLGDAPQRYRYRAKEA